MKHHTPLNDGLSAKERLALSRLSLAVTASEPLWASLARWCIRRCVLQLEQRDLDRVRLAVTERSNPVANGHTPS